MRGEKETLIGRDGGGGEEELAGEGGESIEKLANALQQTSKDIQRCSITSASRQAWPSAGAQEE